MVILTGWRPVSPSGDNGGEESHAGRRVEMHPLDMVPNTAKHLKGRVGPSGLVNLSCAADDVAALSRQVSCGGGVFVAETTLSSLRSGVARCHSSVSICMFTMRTTEPEISGTQFDRCCVTLCCPSSPSTARVSLACSGPC